MPRVFIALENAASAFGFKANNTSNKPDAGKKLSKKDETARALKYKQRRDLAEKIEFDPLTDASEGKGENNIHFIAKMLASKHGYSLGTAGSLPSIFKRLKFEAGQKKMSFDTLIFLGHGNTGLMTVGMGHVPVTKLEEAKGSKKIMEGYDADKRMINVSDESKAHWTETFDDARDCLSVDKTNNVLHVVFMGCATGNQSEKSYKILPKVVSVALAELLKIDVICYGADRLIENSELESAISHIGSITDAAGSSGAAAGSEALSGSEASLEWHRANADD